MLNRICIAGRMAAHAELRRLESGKAVATVSIACDRDFKNGGGDRETDWVDIVAFGAPAEFISKYGAKGRLLIASGRLQVRSWTDKDGNKRRTAEVVADNVYFGDSNREATGGYQSGVITSGYNHASSASNSGYSATSGATDDFAMLEDDDMGSLPF